jgi:hypothetical protein
MSFAPAFRFVNPQPKHVVGEHQSSIGIAVPRVDQSSFELEHATCFLDHLASHRDIIDNALELDFTHS